MATTSEIHSENFDDNNSLEVYTLSALLSSIETKADTGSIPTTHITQTPKQISSIHYLYSNKRRKSSYKEMLLL